MIDLRQQIAHLSAEKRELLELLLREEGVRLEPLVIPRRSGDTDPVPVSFAQQRLWFLDQLDPGSSGYHIPSAVRLTGRLDVAALERALNEIVRRHESLRTTFVEVGEQPRQIIAPSLTLELGVEDLRDLPLAQREGAARRRLREEARRPFDLRRGPLIRARLLRLAEDEQIALLVMHHIVADGWSMGVLIQEIAALYEAFAAGRPSPLPELPIQYADFAAWQRDPSRAAALEQQLAYWKRQLDGALSVLELPTDRPRPPVRTSEGAHLSFRLPASAALALKTLAQQEDATLFMALLAAFQTLLHRYTGQEDISVGTPIACRNRREIEGLIGCFINTLVLRADLSGAPSFRELLRRVRGVTLEAYAHQDLPFEMLVEALQPNRDMSRSPLFQVMLVLQNAPFQSRQLPGLTLSPVDIPTETSTFDLTLSMSEEADGLAVSVEYDTHLFDPATITRWMDHFQTLLEGIAAEPDQSICALPLLSSDERHQLLVAFNDTAAPFPNATLHHLFALQAQRSPHAPALSFEGQILSYDLLNRRANQLAHALLRHGVGPGALVGICLDRSFDLIVALLAVLKAGAAYLPLDPSYPRQRLAFMLDDAQVPLVLTHGSLRPRLADLLAGRELLCLDTDAPAIAQESEADPDSGAGPENLAYCIYTSGSTGRPKGVLIPHRAVVNHACAVAEAFALQPADRVLQFATISFDIAVEEIFPTLLRGATLVLCPESLLTPLELLRLVEAEQLTFLDLPTAYWHEWVYELAQSGAELPPSLRLVVVGGEKALAHRYALWHSLPGAHRVTWLNTYGPTETTVTATLYRPAPGAPPPAELPIGRPIANVQTYVLDGRGEPAPIGVWGELYIGGAGVARGYLNREELTRERFISMADLGFGIAEYSDTQSAIRNPESGIPRLYRTGDRARYLAEGELEFGGRVDEQVKVRGYRIEPGEIEAVLGEHAGVREAAVVAQGERLVAYVVRAEGSEGGGREWREYLKERLPEYMVPGRIVEVGVLPRTPSGKIDRGALPLPSTENREARTENRLTEGRRTAVEEIVAGVWERVLGLERVGVHDHFFDLGGHSLLATQVISRLRQAFQVELPLRHLFEAPTIATLAPRIEQALRTDRAALASPDPCLAPIVPAPREGELPLSFGQQRLWFLDQLEPGSPRYNIPDAVRLTGRLNVAALERALNEVVRRHEVLRTAIDTREGRPVPILSPSLTLPLPRVDLRRVPRPARGASALRLAREEATRPFDLARAPLLRARLLQLEDEEHIVLFTMHHIASDGWSGGVLIQEIAALYEAFAAGRPSPLPELPIQYADFAAWQRGWLQGEVLDAQLEYWTRQLEGSPPLLDLPTDRPRPAVPSYRGDSHGFTLSAELAGRLTDLCRQEGVTLYMALLAAFQTLLSRYSGQEDVCVGTPIAGRNRAEIEGLIGFFVNTLVMRADLSGKPTFRDLLARVREAALGAYAHQDLPFEMLVDALRPERDLSYAPLFQVMFMLQNAGSQPVGLPGLTLSPFDAGTHVSMFDLTLTMTAGPEGLSGEFVYSTDLFDASTIARMTGHFITLLEGIAAEPDRSLAALPLLSPQERYQFLVAFNDTAAPFPDAPFHRLFALQAQRSPHAPALSFEGQILSYDQLNRRANQLAHALRRHGVGPDTLVGICLERSPEMVIALLAVLKAGAAYLPLDPSYPQQRLAFMLDDAQVPLVLTHRSLRPRLADLDGARPAPPLLCLDTDATAIAQQPQEDPGIPVTLDDAAYCIYTSGSTGRPKGALLLHRGLANLAPVLIDTFALTPHSRVLQFASFSFDASLSEILMALLSGATLVLAPRHRLASPQELHALLQQERITTVTLPPSLLAVLPTQGLEELETVVSAGEVCSWEVAARWSGGRRFLNGYGPTETTVAASYYEVGERVAGTRSVPLGRPMANVRMYVLDGMGEPAPVGVWGELYIGGAGVGRGYLNRAELTQERFVPDRFSGEGRLYRTGDRVRYLPDGNLEFRSRFDDQVKLRGFRIELGEIEAALRAHPAVRDAAVLVREEGARRLAAYVVPAEPSAREQAERFIAELRRALAERLPEYMTPSARDFQVLKALPLTPNGKLDRRALPAPGDARPELETPYAAPGTPAEEALAAIWSQMLGLARVGVHDNFFELGGDSILSIQVIARANQAGLRLTPRQLFEHPTIAGLAAASEAPGPERVAEQGVVEGPAPLVPIQRWFFDQERPEPHHWNQSVLLEVQTPFERSLVERAVEHLLAHHDALRMRFVRSESGWQAYNAGLGATASCCWLDLSGLPPQEAGEAIERCAAAEQTRLNLAEGPLARVTYFHLGPGAADRLLIVIHHLVVDAVSWRILLEDFQAVYRQLALGQPVRLPPKTTSFVHWATRLAEAARSEPVRAQAAYWLGVATAASSDRAAHGALPLDFPGGENSERSARNVTVALDAEETRALLHEAPAAYGTEINDLLLAALAEAIGRWTGARVAWIDLEGHGRQGVVEEADLTRTVGWFTSQYPVRLDLREVFGPGEVLKSVKEQLRRVPGQGIGYGLLRYLGDDGALAARLAAMPAPEVSFNYLGQIDAGQEDSGSFGPAREATGPERAPQGARTHRLEINGAVSGGRLEMEWTYSEGLHRRETIERVAQEFIAALRALIAHCREPEAGGYTPSDFALAGLDQRKLDRVLGQLKRPRDGSEGNAR